MRDRFVVCHNPLEAERDRAVREQILDSSNRRSPAPTPCHRRGATTSPAGSSQPGYRPFLRQTKAGLLRIDRAAVAAEERLDGKFLLRTSDPTLSAEDVAPRLQATARSR